ncbi:hypothetical protein GLOTRDRAFT_92667 [Gloeophyllum trabeum ATCC 11539]|uniref:Uncharacterized protein n=1 Tax=Gloeophyllum trabeum (strain ATCC 11539 / FP-39264 / Madison 617) TaxID=670483 RepID=S7Q9U4_GLOTA|nr:uncharacterized protein GLOTRDRAFT_92667 [Gloeophyllum trabeum ATCC 11539]EPQ56113.1 hypothetical protein GLOTRDRAFT_92667 [Gloeophyllum trabeum ATCC 11539]
MTSQERSAPPPHPAETVSTTAKATAKPPSQAPAPRAQSPRGSTRGNRRTGRGRNQQPEQRATAAQDSSNDGRRNPAFPTTATIPIDTAGRDPGVSDQVWRQLQIAKQAQERERRRAEAALRDLENQRRAAERKEREAREAAARLERAARAAREEKEREELTRRREQERLREIALRQEQAHFVERCMRNLEFRGKPRSALRIQKPILVRSQDLLFLRKRSLEITREQAERVRSTRRTKYQTPRENSKYSSKRLVRVVPFVVDVLSKLPPLVYQCLKPEVRRRTRRRKSCIWNYYLERSQPTANQLQPTRREFTITTDTSTAVTDANMLVVRFAQRHAHKRHAIYPAVPPLRRALVRANPPRLSSHIVHVQPFQCAAVLLREAAFCAFGSLAAVQYIEPVGGKGTALTTRRRAL